MKTYPTLADHIEFMSRERPARKKPVRHEDKLHKEVAKYLRAVIGREGLSSRDGVIWFSLEGRAKRSLQEGSANKSRGCVAGVPDILFIHNGVVFFIELKADDGRLSTAQQLLHTELRCAGSPVMECRSVNSVASALRAWRVPTREVV